VADFGDLTTAFCGRLLAGLGSTVVRCGDEVEWLCNDRDARLFYRHGVAARGAGAAAELLAAADVVLTSGTPSQLAAARLDYARLAAARPELVVVNVSPFGLDGPKAEWRANALVAAAAGGMLCVNGWPDEPPLQPLGLQAYHAAGMHGAIGALLALRVRDRCGRGQLVDISLQESALGAVEHITGLYRERGLVARRAGTLHWTRAFRAVPTRDGAALVTHLGDWEALRDWMTADLGATALADGRWRDESYRREHCDELFDAIAAWAARYTTAELVEQGQLRRLAFAPIADLGQAARHPQLRERGFFQKAAGAPCEVPRSVPNRSDLGEAASPLPSPGSRFPVPGAHLPAPGRPLAGIRVLDLTWVVAGPVATRVLADYAAEVVKVEHPRTPATGERRGGLFGNLNRGKTSVVLDLRGDAGQAELRRMIAGCDVLIENFSPRVLANWRLDDAALLALNPRLTVVHMSGFGHSGPRRDWVSFGPTLQAQLGFTAHMRHAGGRPAGWGYSYSDMIGGYAAALAAIAALGSGGGRVVDLSQLEILASVLGPALVAASRGHSPGAVGNASQEGALAPHGVYRCRDSTAGGDRWCAIAVAGAGQWEALLDVTGIALSNVAELTGAAARLRRAAEIDRAIEGWTRERDAAAAAALLQAAGIPAAAVADAGDLLADEHLRHRGVWVRVSTPEGREVELDATPIRLSLTPARIRTAGPLLGPPEPRHPPRPPAGSTLRRVDKGLPED
jgi:crotonobetainyl-CoA:carnitine CoA-transferase CaiB-like acyl-CoA transferase